MRVSAIENIIDDVPSSTQVSAIGNRVTSLETFTGSVAGSTSSLNTRVSSLETSFPDGCNTIMAAVTAKGQTPASNSPSDIATAINNISSGMTVMNIYLTKKSGSTNRYVLHIVVDGSEVVNGAIDDVSAYTTNYINISSGSGSQVYIQIYKGYKYFICGLDPTAYSFIAQTFVPTGSTNYLDYSTANLNYKLRSSSTSIAIDGSFYNIQYLYIVVS